MKARVAHGFLAVGLLMAVAYSGRDPLTAQLIQLAVTLGSAVAVLVGLRWNRTRHPGPWQLFALALLIFILEQLCWTANILAGETVAGPVGNTLDVFAYLAMLAAAVLALRKRTQRDAGGVLDAAVLAVAGGTVIWEFVLLEQLTAWQTPVPGLVTTLSQLLIVVALLGAMVRLAQTASPDCRAVLFYTFGALFWGFVQIVGFPILSDTPLRTPGSVFEASGLLAVVCLGAAALHPSMVHVTEQGPAVADRLTTRRLLLLGTAMMTAPISVGIWQLLGNQADSVLLVVSATGIVPLVMYRIRGLVVQRAAAEAALAHQALHDSLTGLPNRAQFLGLLQDALQRVRTGTSTHVAVLFCDLNGFKAVNDTLGHSAGDHLLIAVAQRLQDCLRGGDVVSRFGGDEFLILSENLDETEIAERVSTRIAAELERPITVGTTKVTIGASIGVAATTASGDLTAEEIIRDADLAMYAAKQTDSPSPRLSGGRSIMPGQAPARIEPSTAVGISLN